MSGETVEAAKVCEECGSTGEGGAIEYSNGKLYHFRKPWPRDGTIRPILCSGKFVEAAILHGSVSTREG